MNHLFPIQLAKRHATLFVVWLIAMQLLTPFIHAHANGVGAATGAIHIHMDDLVSADDVSSTPSIHSEVMPQHVIGVASGVAEKLKLAFLVPALLLVIAWHLFISISFRLYPPLASPVLKSLPNRPQSPRAPPHLN